MARELFMHPPQTPGVTLQPQVHHAMQRGINQVVEAIRPTLGPQPRRTMLERAPRTRSPELLDSGATIARRIIELPNQYENVGAMFVRSMLWRLHEEVGDGAATAAVLFQAIYNQGMRYIAAGGNAMRIRPFLEEGMRIIQDHLAELAFPVNDADLLTRLARSTCYDDDLATAMGEIFDVMGEYGRLQIHAGRRRDVTHEFIQGSYWPGGVLTNPGRQSVQMDDVALLLCDLEIDDPRELVAALHRVMQSGVKTLVIVARTFSEQALGLFASSQNSDKLRVLAIKVPGAAAPDQADALTDLAVLTGGLPLYSAAGDTLRQLTPEHLGQARRIWADKEFFNVITGQGDAHALRDHLTALRQRHAAASDPVLRDKLAERIGRLWGGTAMLHVGGATETELKTRRELAERTATLLRGAVRSGALYGGGNSLLACRAPLEARLATATEEDERVAFRILLDALAAPLRALLTNAGLDPGAVLAELTAVGPEYGYDIAAHELVRLADSALLDVAAVQHAVVQTAISSAALALTVDVMVHRHQPEYTLDPD